jgi:predicted RNA-binding protein with RPS1 domain
MAIKPHHPEQHPCLCGGANPNCVRCGGKGYTETPGFRPIMSGPSAVRRRLLIPSEGSGTIQGPPEPIRCPHCALEILNLTVHMAEAHPEMPTQETDAEREAREQEEARQAAAAAEIARREAEATQRKAEARVRRQEAERQQQALSRALRAGGNPPQRSQGQHEVPARPVDSSEPANPTSPPRPTDAGSRDGGRLRSSGSAEERGAREEKRFAGPESEAWERMKKAFAERTVLTGVVRSSKPFGVFVALGGIEGLLRSREMLAKEAGREAAGLQDGKTVKVIVIGMTEDTHRVELSMRRLRDPQAPQDVRHKTAPVIGPAEGPMALAFRLAREKKGKAD